MKENTKQILKVCVCTLIALILFVGVILMCIYFAFDNTTKGVADAYTDEEVGVSNLEFTVDEGFYIKNFNESNVEEIERLLNYFMYFIPDLMSPGVDFYYFYQAGTIRMNYTDNNGYSLLKDMPIFLEFNKDSDNNFLQINVLISEYNDLYFLYLTYDYGSNLLDEFILDIYTTQSAVYPYNYYVNFTSHPVGNTFAYQFVSAIFDDAGSVYSIDSLEFKFFNFINLGVFFSPNQVFASPPVVMPDGVYDQRLEEYRQYGYEAGLEDGQQEGYDQGYQEGIEESQETIDELQAELNRYKSYYESIGWFDVLSSSLNNVALIDIDGYKSTYVDVRVSDGTNNQVHVWNLDENPGNGTAFAVVLPRYFGNGTRFRFSYRDLIGSASGMANLPVSLGYINSTGNLITIMELPVSSETFVEFNISEDVNTFVIYTTGNLILFQDFKFQVFSFDEIGIYDDGFADGKDEGIKYGEQVGYEKGYSDARDKYINNDYSFFALFSSVLDAPLQMIIGTDDKPGMLNFYIPGLDINIAPFLLSLFSVALVITIIRFILARAS